MRVDIEIVQELPLPDTSAGRSIGVHVSDIIRCLAQESGLLAIDHLEDLSLISIKDLNSLPIGTLLRIHFGLAWERYYLPLLPNVQDHPSERCVDDIFMSPDGLELTHFIVMMKNVWHTLVHEVKCTSKSINTVGNLSTTAKKSQFMWLTQLKSYCRAVGARRAILHVLFLYGNYKRPFEPCLWKYNIEFTPQEIRENWLMVTEYKQYRLEVESKPELYKPVEFFKWAGVEDDDE